MTPPRPAPPLFHSVEKEFIPRGRDFPQCGKIAQTFSIVWKNRANLFHCVEQKRPVFPRCGKRSAKFFHCVEKPKKLFPLCGTKTPHFSTVWKILPVAAGLALAGCRPAPPPPATLPPGQDAAVSATLSTNTIHIGDIVTLRLDVVHRPGTAITFPNPARGQDIMIRDAQVRTTEQPNGLLRTEQTLELTSLTITNHIIGEGAAIVVSLPTGLHWTNAYPFVALEVVSALQPGEEHIRPAKSLLARWPAPRGRWLWGLGLALAALLAAGWALRALLRTPRTFLHFPPPTPPHEVALAALAALRAKDWIATRRFAPFYVELSAIVRHYLEGRFGLRAPERTTEEFIREAAAARQLTADQRERVADFLTQSDLVKFARHAPDEAAMHAALDSAARLVHETIPAAEPAAAAGGAP